MILKGMSEQEESFVLTGVLHRNIPGCQTADLSESSAEDTGWHHN